ncbi:hypothetical protein [Nonomuraea sp. NPDC001831]|uniref:hypothetical protein n=1 Tax=Nonomuraea sp. NPDC001831 TaxID=3364340 RepID=UPI0036753A01
MARPLPALLCLLLAVSAAACTPGRTTTPAQTPSPVRRPVADAPPYLCNFVPRAALAELTGYTGSYKAGPNSRHPVGNTCVVSNDERSLVITSYDVSARPEIFETFAAHGKDGSPVQLPPELGKGQIHDFKARLYPFRSAGVWFRCGAASPFIGITIMRNPARDQDDDLVQLVRIAQRRYGEMFACTPAADPR